jgi:hypothetical protein
MIEIGIKPIDEVTQSAVLSADERLRVLEIVADPATAFGLAEDPRMRSPQGFEQDKDSIDPWTYKIIALYERLGDEATGHSRVQLEVRQDKSSGTTSVHVFDRHGRSYDAFSMKLEASLVDRLSAALPQRHIVVSQP